MAKLEQLNLRGRAILRIPWKRIRTKFSQELKKTLIKVLSTLTRKIKAFVLR